MDDILWIGSARSEFESIISTIERTSHLRRVASLAEAGDAIPPQVAILAAARPAEFEESQVAELRAKWWGTRFVYVLGAWCCGQKRICEEFSRVPTVYAHECGTERVLDLVGVSASNRHAGVVPPVSGLIAIYSQVISYREAIADALVLSGMKTVESDVGRTIRTHGVDTVVWHAPANFERRADELEELFDRHPGAQILALLTYARAFESTRLASRGVRVLAQPFELADLVQAIQPSASKPVSSAA